MQTYGRLAARNGDIKAINSAAEYLAICTENETRTLLSYFDEGVRNYAEDTEQTTAILNLVTEKAITLISEDRELIVALV